MFFLADVGVCFFLFFFKVMLPWPSHWVQRKRLGQRIAMDLLSRLLRLEIPCKWAVLQLLQLDLTLRVWLHLVEHPRPRPLDRPLRLSLPRCRLELHQAPRLLVVLRPPQPLRLEQMVLLPVHLLVPLMFLEVRLEEAWLRHPCLAILLLRLLLLLERLLLRAATRLEGGTHLAVRRQLPLLLHRIYSVLLLLLQLLLLVLLLRRCNPALACPLELVEACLERHNLLLLNSRSNKCRDSTSVLQVSTRPPCLVVVVVLLRRLVKALQTFLEGNNNSHLKNSSSRNSSRMGWALEEHFLSNRSRLSSLSSSLA